MKGNELVSKLHAQHYCVGTVIELLSGPLIEACMHCIQLLDKVCIEQFVEVLLHVCDKTHIY